MVSGKNKSTSPGKEPQLVGKYKQVRVSIVGASFLKSEGTTRYRDEGLGLFILDEVFRRQSILSKRKGLLRKTHHCRKCKAGLMELKAHRRRFSLNIAYKEVPPFKLEIEMPAISCRECGTNNAVNEDATEFIISGAIAKALEPLSRSR